eukprot:419748-Pelagomonas_calceolata.AAC.4
MSRPSAPSTSHSYVCRYNEAKAMLHSATDDRMHHLRDAHPYAPFPIDRLARAASTVDLDVSLSNLNLAMFSLPSWLARVSPVRKGARSYKIAVYIIWVRIRPPDWTYFKIEGAASSWTVVRFHRFMHADRNVSLVRTILANKHHAQKFLIGINLTCQSLGSKTPLCTSLSKLSLKRALGVHSGC